MIKIIVQKSIQLSLLCLVFAACKTTTPIRPIEKYDQQIMEKKTSTINIPVRIDKNELQKSINEKIGESLYEDNDMGDDDLMIRAEKKEDIEIEIENDALFYRVPLKLWIRKKTFVGNVEAEGEIALDFRTGYEIEENWNLTTKTEILQHQWKKRPVLKLGFVDLPIKFIANQVLKKTENLLADAIDDQVKKQFNLEKEIKAAWKKLHEPLLLSEEYRTWVVFNPESIKMSPLALDQDTIESTIIFKSNPVISLGEKPAAPSWQPLPNFEFEREKGEDFAVYLQTDLPMQEARNLAKQNLIGERFEYGKRYVKVEDIELYGSGKNLVINMLLSGGYHGNVYAQGEPKYNAKTNQIELDGLDFDFTSQRFLMRTMSWLFKSKIKDRIHEEMNFQLGEKFGMAQIMIQEQLKNMEITKGITLQGNLNEMKIASVQILPESLEVEVALAGDLRMDVKGIGE